MEIQETLKIKELDHLNAAVLQFSKDTLASKKVCASLLVAIIGIILKITDNILDPSIYVAGYVTILLFWILDSYSYYFQRKIRIRMSQIANELKNKDFLLDGYGMPLLKNEKPSWKRAFFNNSQLFYLLLGIIGLIIMFVDYIGCI